MKEKIKLGVIGLGQRGMMLLPLFCEDDVEVSIVCDVYSDRVKDGADFVEEKTGKRPQETLNYKDVLKSDIDGVFIFTSWEMHVPIAVEAMKAGIYVGLEVGGAYSVKQCWDLVKAHEETGTELMLLENCCFGRRELMILNMVKMGVFGEVVHAAGGYCHDLREEVTYGEKLRHYRLRNYLTRNCENYPTHELGPIAKVLNINNGNRMVSLSSVASSARGINEYIKKQRELNPDYNFNFGEVKQGDVVTTIIKCLNGETITLTLNTTLPRAYSRKFSIYGTKAQYEEDNDSLFIDGIHNEYDFKWKEQWGNAEEFAEAYEHPLWKEYKKNPIGGHDGIDWLTINDFIDCVK
ncbi:MAG: Gfo/Idh/MocA family oxidoreductase, partial [Clostridia bacterium]|nr:Gfo/Idh/MocA family oxidoreductase [Clostridia bacterium]